MDAWIECELAGCEFPDPRLKARYGKILHDLSDKIGATTPTACQDWAATKAAYRFFSNPRVNESLILAGHFAATQSRMAAAKGTLLMLHDTTEFSYQRIKPQLIGKLHDVSGRKDRPKKLTVCGLLMHSSLVITPQGKPLGLTAIKFWTRKKFKGTNALQGRGAEGCKHSLNLARIPIEQKESVRWLENMRQATELSADPSRCVHIADREGDIFELFCEARRLNTHFLVRTCVDRVADQGQTTVAQVMKREKVRGRRTITIYDHKRRLIKVKVSVRYRRLTIHPPIGKHKRYPKLKLTVIEVRERGTPKNRTPVHWKLLTNLPVKSMASALEKVGWYAQRWKIETFHKVLKSGCQAEESKLRTAQRLTNLIAVYCVISWRVFWLTMVHRTNPNTPANKVFTKVEITILDQIAGDSPPNRQPISRYLAIVAKLGGYLTRKNDGPPGNMVLWRGLTRLTDIHLGYNLGLNLREKLVGN